jgi:hypothetical protein
MEVLGPAFELPTAKLKRLPPKFNLLPLSLDYLYLSALMLC